LFKFYTCAPANALGIYIKEGGRGKNRASAMKKLAQVEAAWVASQIQVKHAAEVRYGQSSLRFQDSFGGLSD